MRTPRVCILCGDPFSGHHGSYKQAFLQAKEIAKNGVDVIMVSPTIDETHCGIKIEKHKLNGVEFCRVSSKLFRIKLLKMISGTIYLFLISNKFDIIQIITSHFCYTGFLLSYLFEKKFVIVTTSSREYFVKPGKLEKTKLWVIAKADIIITKTSQLFDSYKSLFPSSPEIVKISNGVNTVRFSPVSLEQKMSLRNEFGYNHQEKIILFAGNILREKGVDILVDQYVKNRTRLSKSKLFLVGNNTIDSNYTKKIIQMIDYHDLSNNIKLLGPTQNIERYYQIADIFILPSEREGLPNVVLEAMSSGLPCIVSDLGYTKELFSENLNGFVFPLAKPDKLSEILLKLINAPTLSETAGMNARKTIKKNYSLDAVAERYCDLYDHLALRTKNTHR